MSIHVDRYPIDDEIKTALVELLEQFPGGFNAPDSLAERRDLISNYLRQFPKNEDVLREDDVLASSKGSHHIPIRIYRPKDGLRNSGVIFAIHGGGMVMGGIEDDDSNASRLCLEFGVTVVAIDYRLAPEHPFPAAVDDCFDVASWVLAHGSRLGVDTARSVLYGGSAGGALAIATAMNLRDHGERTFSAVVAPYPMVDHTNTLPSTHRILDLGVWDRKASVESWSWYLGPVTAASDSDQVHPYAAPLHAPDLSELPPIFIDVGDCDLFLDEDLRLVARLIESGVSVEFHCYPGAFHACELFAPEAALSRKIWSNRFEFIRKWLADS